MTAIQQKPYLIDSVIGNGRILACLTQTGELVRAFWPTIDYAQHINKTEAALRVNGDTTHYPLSGNSFTHQQRYVPDTNIVETTYSSAQLPFAVRSYDFVATDLDVIVREYLVTNNGGETVEVDLLYLTDFHMEESPIYQSVLYDNQFHAIGHYRRKYWTLIGGADRPFGFQVGNVSSHLHTRRLNGYGGPTSTLGSDGAQVFTATVQPGETVTFPVLIAFGSNRDEAGEALTHARAMGAAGLRAQATQTAQDFLARGRQIATGNEAVDVMYRRSLLVFSLMADAVHGGLIAAPEFDPFYTQCGGYGYCWGRDAGYITTAIDMAGYHDIGRKFYEWAMQAQDADGSWDHRHYMNGDLAPAWGYQADEPASILWGMWQHFLITGDEAFLQSCWSSMERGANHLLATLADNGMPRASMDLWEERFAQHTYSSAAVAASLFAVADAAHQLGHAEQAAQYRTAGETIRGEVEKLFNEHKQSWYRGINLYLSPEEFNVRKEAGLGVHIVQDEHGYDRAVADYDTIVDASLLGMSYPFALFDAEHPSVVATAESVRELCTQKGVGGIRRYENDIYAGGNPWVLCSLWLALDANRRGDAATVREVLEWVLDNQTQTGLLPEQVDKNHGGPGWVVPLTWSHAMYVLTIVEHFGK
ncbi:glycoside hydrolase family 15 protein [Tumebacillus permanentifrigoris]|uniref:Oligosaccharide amylase n=1 Tax=Tumebacillus permanentifrigoris TaxID=378543 RepID=A0A316DBG1_9BACL|nr:glycoside hydrolase family 15 protein [Tumebacillus permanentifrigoris]PWK13364.1 oligosaccharide amylase [Tumebacillus permanentifrigoris]